MIQLIIVILLVIASLWYLGRKLWPGRKKNCNSCSACSHIGEAGK